VHGVQRLVLLNFCMMFFARAAAAHGLPTPWSKCRTMLLAAASIVQGALWYSRVAEPRRCLAHLMPGCKEQPPERCLSPCATLLAHCGALTIAASRQFPARREPRSQISSRAVAVPWKLLVKRLSFLTTPNVPVRSSEPRLLVGRRSAGSALELPLRLRPYLESARPWWARAALARGRWSVFVPFLRSRPA